MKLASFEAIVGALESAGVRFLVAGGLAVSAHGYLRFTKDVDLVVQLLPENIKRAFHALSTIGYKPRVPIAADQFADPELREVWTREKGMLVLQFWSDEHRETPVDLFVYEPFDFDAELNRALTKPLHGTIPVRFVSIPTLIRMRAPGARRIRSTSSICASDRSRMSKTETDPIDWSLTTWDGSLREQLRRWSELPLERIIAAQEEMQELATKLAAAPKIRVDSRRT